MTAQKPLPVIMSAPMILGLLARRKLQTRRTRGLEEIKRTARLVGYGRDHRGRFAADFDDPEGDGCYLVTCPYGGPGTRLWVREGVRRVELDDVLESEFDPATHRVPPGQVAQYIADGAPAPIDSWGWKNKALPAIHMPYGVRRFELELTEVRVERVQVITEADAIAEGLEPRGRGWGWPGAKEAHATARAAYQAGWEWLNGAASWAQNPLVWVLTFTTDQVR